MLVLSRKKNESIIVRTPAGEIRCTIIEIRGDKVRLGWEAPAEIPIHRKEVFDSIRRQEAWTMVSIPNSTRRQ
jgi:carbon storage regulator